MTTFLLHFISNLHPTMYLLILLPMQDLLYSYPYLHPTMYLLIHALNAWVDSNYNNLHPTMYLLIPKDLDNTNNTEVGFTSHYVSINSIMAI